MDVEFLPTPQNDSFLLSYLQDSFNRIRDAFRRIPRTDSGQTTFVGSIQITTNLTTVTRVVASLDGLPSANACFVRAAPVGSGAPKDIYLFVYTNAFALAPVSMVVDWIAVGE